MSAVFDRPPTIADVARLAGVSLPTVSRVLTGKTPVSPKMRARVSQAMEELGYRPNGAARALVSGRRSMIAVLAGNTARFGWARTIQGIEVAARKAGFLVIVAVVESGEPGDVDRAVDLVLSQNVAGVIVLEFDVPGREVLHKLPSRIPVVAAAGGTRRGGEVPYALLNERSAGRAVTEYLLGLGHRTVHHIAQPTMGRATGRTTGWRIALDEARAEVPEVVHATWDPRSAYRIGTEMAGQDDITAVFCANDDVAIAVMRAFSDRGLRTPEDISVMGFDDHPLGEFQRPALSTVHQDFDDLGARAFKLLSELLSGDGHERNSVITPSLVIRESTGPARQRGPHNDALGRTSDRVIGPANATTANR